MMTTIPIMDGQKSFEAASAVPCLTRAPMNYGMCHLRRRTQGFDDPGSDYYELAIKFCKVRELRVIVCYIRNFTCLCFRYRSRHCDFALPFLKKQRPACPDLSLANLADAADATIPSRTSPHTRDRHKSRDPQLPGRRRRLVPEPAKTTINNIHCTSVSVWRNSATLRGRRSSLKGCHYQSPILPYPYYCTNWISFKQQSWNSDT